jgi:dienelactone hydrolase
MRSNRRICPLLIAISLLMACNNKNGNDMSGLGSSEPPARGALLQSPPDLVTTLTAADLLAKLDLSTNQQLLALAASPVCDVLIYDVKYETVGGQNEPTTASAALMVPTGVASSCTGSRPIVLYAHGTTVDRKFTMTNLDNPESLTLAALFASHGYIVVAPNYAGYDTSTLDYHPYLIADQQSKDMIDSLAASRTALPLTTATTTKDGGRLFVTGYSQGGYVAMATERAMQSGGMTVTAAAPMSGPYALAAFVDAVFFGRVAGDATVSSTLLFTAYQRTYDIYTDPTEVFEAQYAEGIDSLLPTTLPRSELYSEGKLPENALFSATPPAPEFAPYTPATTPADLAEIFAMGFGAGNLITNSYRLAYLQDAQANPDGGFPAVTTGVAAAAPGLAGRKALKTNDLRNWAPTVPTFLCGGAMDPLVFWMNSQLIQNYWAIHAPTAPVSVLDLESAVAANDPYGGLKNGFAAAKDLVAASAVAQGATDGGALAVAEAYHATLVAPFCFAAVKSFFGNY